jgi:mandelamide amidase
LLGKTNLHELAFGITNTNFGVFPATRNPHDLKRITGGSSGGTAAAIAAGVVSAGLGTDTSGSIRIPAAFCGVAGLRPSVGAECQDRRYSADGVLPISHTNDTPGPMAVSTEDLALLDAIVTGTKPVSVVTLKGLRLGLPECFWSDLDPEVESTCLALCDTLAREGVELINLTLPRLRETWKMISAPVVLHEPLADIPAWLARNGRTDISLLDVFQKIVNPDVRAAFEVIMAQNLGEDYRSALQNYRPELCRIYREIFDTNGLDALIFPTIPISAPLINTTNAFDTVRVNSNTRPVFETCIRNTDPGANAGLPGLSFPVGFTKDGLPVGIELDGPVGSDRSLLSIGMAVERLIQQ